MNGTVGWRGREENYRSSSAREALRRRPESFGLLGLESNLQGSVIFLERKIEDVHARNTGTTPQDRAPKTECFPENDLAARKGSGEAKVTRTSYATWTALSSRLAKTRRTSVMISSLVLSASLRLTCILIVFGRRTITKAKKQKDKKRRSRKRKSEKV